MKLCVHIVSKVKKILIGPVSDKKPPARLPLKTLMASSNTSALSTPVFNEENYQVWAVKMKAYLRGLGLWQWVETERQIQPLGNNPTLNQIRDHEEEEANAPRALSYIHVVVSEPIFHKDYGL